MADETIPPPATASPSDAPSTIPRLHLEILAGMPARKFDVRSEVEVVVFGRTGATLETHAASLGRPYQCVVLSHDMVSSLHCQITYNAATRKYALEDLKSRNGVSATNSEAAPMVKVKGGGPAFELESGARIKIGITELRVTYGVPSTPESTPATLQQPVLDAAGASAPVVASAPVPSAPVSEAPVAAAPASAVEPAPKPRASAKPNKTGAYIVLELKVGDAPTRLVDVEKQPTYFGTDAAALASMKQVEKFEFERIVIPESKEMAPCHFKIWYDTQEKHYFLQDRASECGTFLRPPVRADSQFYYIGDRHTCEQICPLYLGSTIKAGDVEFRVISCDTGAARRDPSGPMPTPFFLITDPAEPYLRLAVVEGSVPRTVVVRGDRTLLIGRDPVKLREEAWKHDYDYLPLPEGEGLADCHFAIDVGTIRRTISLAESHEVLYCFEQTNETSTYTVPFPHNKLTDGATMRAGNVKLRVIGASSKVDPAKLPLDLSLLEPKNPPEDIDREAYVIVEVRGAQGERKRFRLTHDVELLIGSSQYALDEHAVKWRAKRGGWAHTAAVDDPVVSYVQCCITYSTYWHHFEVQDLGSKHGTEVDIGDGITKPETFNVGCREGYEQSWVQHSLPDLPVNSVIKMTRSFRRVATRTHAVVLEARRSGVPDVGLGSTLRQAVLDALIDEDGRGIAPDSILAPYAESLYATGTTKQIYSDISNASVADEEEGRVERSEQPMGLQRAAGYVRKALAARLAHAWRRQPLPPSPVMRALLRGLGGRKDWPTMLYDAVRGRAIECLQTAQTRQEETFALNILYLVNGEEGEPFRRMNWETIIQLMAGLKHVTHEDLVTSFLHLIPTARPQTHDALCRMIARRPTAFPGATTELLKLRVNMDSMRAHLPLAWLGLLQGEHNMLSKNVVEKRYVIRFLFDDFDGVDKRKHWTVKV